MLTTVTLGTCVRHGDNKGKAAGRYLQGSDQEHDDDANLLLPVQIETADLPQGNGNHPQVQGDADGGIGPADSVLVKTEKASN